MKTAIYIEDGRTQLVLTPESEIDKKVLKSIEELKDIKVFRGSFYSCQGGWSRWREKYADVYGGVKEDDDSLIIVADKDEKE
ncbi:hypothetical protein LCGC14_0902420 [marine sediment metagenome]|uniref:Uncharacterized protein n=1 Tax=marine sediment metagenome TaxID=412755 RepID=A0A0F9S2W6_9ZZZZ